jgi:hypothetical protein
MASTLTTASNAAGDRHTNASLKAANLIRKSVSEAFGIELGIELACGDEDKAASAGRIELAGNE